mgnify:CR=1 FL=1
MPISAELFQSLNPFFVVFLTPVIMAIFASQRRRGKEPSTPKKIAIGMGIAALAFIVMAVGSYFANLPLHKDIIAVGTSPVKVTPLLLMLTYLILTVAAIPISFLFGFLNDNSPIPDSIFSLCDKQDPPVMFFLTNESPHHYFFFCQSNLYRCFPGYLCFHRDGLVSLIGFSPLQTSGQFRHDYTFFRLIF